MRLLISLAIALLPGSLAAQPAPTQPYEPGFAACIQTAGPQECLGQASDACMQSEPGGQTTFGMSACLAMEGQLWSYEISREMMRATRALRAQDAEHREFFDEQFSGAAEALAASQATWAAWAEAECNLVSAEAGSGSIRHLNAGHCTNRLAAERLARLRQIGSMQ